MCVYVCVSMGSLTPQYAYGGERIDFENWFYPSPVGLETYPLSHLTSLCFIHMCLR